MIVFDQFVAKYVFNGFFGGHVGHFLGRGNGFPKMRGVFQKGGGILCFEVFF